MPYADVTPEDVVARLALGEDVYLLDVRETEEVAEWAYPIGVHIPMGQLAERLDELPEDRTIVVACAAGSRSATVASALSERGWVVENLAGGAIAWAAMEPKERDGS